jgi:hypothetical protein
LLIAAADVADGLRRKRNYAGNTGCGGGLGQLQKSQGAQDNTDLLDSAAHQLPEFFLMLGRHFNTKGWTGHTVSMGLTMSEWNCFVANTSSGQRPSWPLGGDFIRSRFSSDSLLGHVHELFEQFVSRVVFSWFRWRRLVGLYSPDVSNHFDGVLLSRDDLAR